MVAAGTSSWDSGRETDGIAMYDKLYDVMQGRIA